MVTVIVIVILDIETYPGASQVNMWGLLGENAANRPS